jgi:L-fuconolactonase
MTPLVIDSHLHLWDLEVGEYPWLGPSHGALFASFLPEQAAQELSASGVDGAVLVQAEDSAAETAWLLGVAERFDWVLGVVGWVQLDDPAIAARQLEEWLQHPAFCGVRHLIHDDPRDDFLELATVRQSLRLLSDAQLVLDVPDAWPRHLAQATALAADQPELRVVLDHLGKPPRGSDQLDAWRTELARFAAQPNTVAKLSGLRVTGQPYSADALRFVWDAALELFGPARLLWGSDWPMTVPDGGYGPTKAVLDELIAALTESERSAILGETATEIYGLGTDKGRMYTQETVQLTDENETMPANTSDLTARGIS